MSNAIPPGAVEQPRFVGRATELRLLDSALERAKSGRGQVCVVAGDPGIRKTRLVEELRRSAHQRGLLTLVGRSREAGAVAYWPWAEILERYVSVVGASHLQAAVSASQLRTLSSILPSLRGSNRGREAERRAVETGFRLETFEAVASVLRRAASEVPLLLVLEDLHCADAATLLLLRFLGAQLEHSPIALVVTLRSAETRARPEAIATRTEIEVWPNARTVELRGLARSDVTKLIRDILGTGVPSEVCDRIAGRSEGNPLFVSELARAALPPAIRDVIGQRLDALSASCQSALRTATVLGREFSAASLAQVHSGGEAAIAPALEEATAAHVAERESQPRAAIHRRIAIALEDRLQRGERLASSTQRELAHHAYELALATGEIGAALEHISRAAGEAAAIAAFEDAAALHR